MEEILHCHGLQTALSTDYKLLSYQETACKRLAEPYHELHKAQAEKSQYLNGQTVLTHENVADP